MNNLISTPIDLPIVQPVDWMQWWDLWHRESRPVVKAASNHNKYAAPWKGLDIWVRPGVDAASETKYKAKNLDCPELFPSIFENLEKFPIDIDIVRMVSSMGPVLPHTDHGQETLSVRSLVYDNNIRPTFYYMIDGVKTYQQLPPTTNSWMYWDHKTAHGTDWVFGHSKLLITYFGRIKESFNDDAFKKTASSFADFAISSS